MRYSRMATFQPRSCHHFKFLPQIFGTTYVSARTSYDRADIETSESYVAQRNDHVWQLICWHHPSYTTSYTDSVWAKSLERRKHQTWQIEVTYVVHLRESPSLWAFGSGSCQIGAKNKNDVINIQYSICVAWTTKYCDWSEGHMRIPTQDWFHPCIFR